MDIADTLSIPFFGQFVKESAGLNRRHRQKATLVTTTAVKRSYTNFDLLHDLYCDWIRDLTEMRKRMEALRDETRIGWKPPENISRVLTILNREDDWFAARNMDGARNILAAAEACANDTRPHRLARIERCKKRIAALERAYEAGWRPHEGKKWPDPEVVAWCDLFGGFRFNDLDSVERTIEHFEARLAA